MRVCECLTHTHILFQGLWQGLILHSVSPTRWLSATLGWSVIHFQNLCIAIIKGGLEARFPHGTARRTLPFGAPRNISNQEETISSWHIINYTCRSFPLGRSSDTLENKSPDVVLNQRDTACEAGISPDTFKKWANGFSDSSTVTSGAKSTIDWLLHLLHPRNLFPF